MADNNIKRTIETGINGSGAPVWIVVSEWINPAGRKMSHRATFDNEPEAINWIKWA